MSDIKWIKINVDLFDHRKIKYIRTLPEGNEILLFWVMLLTSAGKCNMGGHIFLTTDIPYTSEMLAEEFNIQNNTIKLALETFRRLNMISLDNGIFVQGWKEYQNVDGMEKIREQTRNRVSRLRADKKFIKDKSIAISDINDNGNIISSVTCNDDVTQSNVTCNDDVTQSNVTCNDDVTQSNVTCNVTVTQCNATEVEVEVDLEKKGLVAVVDFLPDHPQNLQKTPEKVFQENISILTPHIAERIKHLLDDGITEELLTEYILVSVSRGKGSWSYIEKMAMENTKKNITTLEQYKASLVEWEKRKSITKEVKKPQYANFDQREYKEEDYDKYYANLQDM